MVDIIRVKAGTELANLFLKIKLISGGSTSLTFIKCTQSLTTVLKVILKKQGVKGLTLHLKSSSIALQQSVSGYIIKDLTQVGPRVSRTRSGLPRLIPSSHRLIIRNRLPGYKILIKFYLSVFYIYRVLEFAGKVKLETITKPGKIFDLNRYLRYIPAFNDLMIRSSRISYDKLQD